ncbi:hypothetical protein [Xylophilus sp. GOD-11R]|uniref:hypothetical protein n=1 Tax=Xylophilus sp. GOD-11R TaxID=3089814 RepID=UPI00298D1D5B|nr:hypothetical protein [Xylophilus sp. GOD-11R]WPB56260.1 hypothetical protein R9X41_19260 [Xylophilus sp. GOD-11R]
MKSEISLGQPIYFAFDEADRSTEPEAIRITIDCFALTASPTGTQHRQCCSGSHGAACVIRHSRA